MKNNITVKVEGLHCASCAKIIEDSLSEEPGLKIININPITEQASLEIESENFQPEIINSKLSKLGYHFIFPDDFLKIADNQPRQTVSSEKESELSIKKNQLKITLPLMFLILFIVFWSLAAKYFEFTPEALIPEYLFLPFTFLSATLILFWSGQNFLKAAVRFIRYGRANMDTLIGLGTGVAYFYSSLIYLFPELRIFLGLSSNYFFDVTIVVITLVNLGKYLENKAKAYTNQTIEKLLQMQAKTVWIEAGGQEIEKPLSELAIGEIALVKPGMKIPSDGVIVLAEAAIDESLISGEAMPVDKKMGDKVIGSTLNINGFLKIKISKVGADTILAAIIKATQEAQNSKAPIQRLADKVAGIFVPIVISLAAASLIIWLTIGPHFFGWSSSVSLGLTCFISILAISCPCALGLATPTGIMIGLGLASKNGLLIKNAASLERFGRVKTIVFDKTGTITKGAPAVADILEINGRRQDILQITASLENYSEHPLAQAIINAAKNEKLPLLAVAEFQTLSGLGLEGKINNNKYFVGSCEFIRTLNVKPISQEINDKLQNLTRQGKTLIALSDLNGVIGFLSLTDELKSESREVVDELGRLGIKTIMLSGDQQMTADYIARQANINEVIAGVSPLQKSEIINRLKDRDGLTAMVGDGMNDAVALAAADIGIAMATGSDIAIESADITILHGDLSKIIKAIKISRLTIKKIKQNLFWAFFYNIIAIPIAAGLLYPAYGLLLSPIIAAGAMSLSSLSVIFNTLLMKKVHI